MHLSIYIIHLCALSIYYIIYTFISYVRPFGPTGGAKCKMVSTRNAIRKYNSSLKFEGQVRK